MCLQIEKLRKQFGPIVAVRDFDLTVARGEFVSLLGPSGCGKSTILRMIAGFAAPSAGAIRIDGSDITHLRPSERNLGMMFPSYALFPNMSVADNIGFGLRIAGRPRAEVRMRVGEALALVGLPELGGRLPKQLSGGQRQSVALARALSVKPQALILDEPLVALDADIRVSLREEIRALQRALSIATVYATCDRDEALSISDRVVVMNAGQVEQIGAPSEICT